MGESAVFKQISRMFKIDDSGTLRQIKELRKNGRLVWKRKANPSDYLPEGYSWTPSTFSSYPASDGWYQTFVSSSNVYNLFNVNTCREATVNP